MINCLDKVVKNTLTGEKNNTKRGFVAILRIFVVVCIVCTLVDPNFMFYLDAVEPSRVGEPDTP